MNSIDSHIIRGYILILSHKNGGYKMKAISIRNLSKTYKDGKIALNEMSLDIKKGEIFSLLGTNGAGKTTLINILTTFLEPTSGKVNILDKDIKKDRDFIRSKIACVAQSLSIDDYLTLKENMIFQSRLYSIDKTTALQRIDTLVRIFDLKDYMNKKVALCSGGIKRRLDIVMSMISFPQILFLDEPTVGMDIQSRMAMWEMLKRIKKELSTTIILTTHYLEEADILSDTICFIKDGYKILQDSPSNLKYYTKQNLIKVHLDNQNNAEKIQKELSSVDCVNSSFLEGNVINLYVVDCRKNLPEINQYVLNSNISFMKIEIVEPTLDDIFIAIMNEHERGGTYGDI